MTASPSGSAALALVGLVSYGARGSLGLFIEPWEEAFGATRADVSLIVSIGFVALGLGQPVAGRLLESIEPGRVLVGGLCSARSATRARRWPRTSSGR